MLESKVEKKVENLIEEIKNSDNQQMSRQLEDLKADFNDDDIDDLLKYAASKLIEGEYDEADYHDYMLKSLKYFKRHAKSMKKSYTLEISINGIDEDCLFRRIVVPASFTLADVVYAVLGTLNVRNASDFIINDDGYYFYSPGHLEYVKYGKEDHLDLATHYSIDAFDYKKGDALFLYYGRTDNKDEYYQYEYEYTIELFITRIKKYNEIFTEDDLEALEAVGYGLWEGAKELMVNYFMDRDKFDEMVEDMDEDIPFLEYEDDFDEEDCLESIFVDYISVRNSYKGK